MQTSEKSIVGKETQQKSLLERVSNRLIKALRLELVRRRTPLPPLKGCVHNRTFYDRTSKEK